MYYYTFKRIRNISNTIIKSNIIRDQIPNTVYLMHDIYDFFLFKGFTSNVVALLQNQV